MNNYIFFIGTLLEGGAERVISILTKELADEKDTKVSIVLWYDKDTFYQISPKVNLIKIPQMSGNNNFFQNLLWFRKFLKKEKGVLISFLASFNMLAIVAHLFVKTPIIVADRSDPSRVPTNYFIRKIRDILYIFADGVVLQTKQNSRYFSHITSSKKTVIYNPILLGDRNGIALSTNKKKKIVSVGRLIPLKNHELLINAFSLIIKKYPDYELWIYGEGMLRAHLEEIIKRLDLSKRIYLPGNSKKVYEEICDAEIFVLSSNYEGMPNALLEAMCLGLPVISTKVSGASDIIKDGENGYLDRKSVV